MRRIILIVAILLLSGLPAVGQISGTGVPPYTSIDREGFDGINLQNLNVSLAVPFTASPGRGPTLSIGASYNSLIWHKVNGAWTPATDPSGAFSWGWNVFSPVGGITYTETTGTCQFCIFPGHCQGYTTYSFGGYSYVEPNGTVHPFNVAWYTIPQPCSGAGTFGTMTGYATDGSGYYVNATIGYSPIVTSPSGTQMVTNGQTGITTLTDTNGNFVQSKYVSSQETDWIDSVGRTALKIQTNTLNAGIVYSFLDQFGSYSNTVGVTRTSLPIKTNFACSGVIEYTGSATLVTEIDLPSFSGERYTITYEQTPGASGYYTGRVRRITLPTGGYYEFDYPGVNDSINCADGTTTRLNRVMSDGTNVSTWQFTRTQIDSSHWKTVTTAPQMPYDTIANDSVYVYTNGQQTQTQIYQGSSAGGGTLLRTVNTLWTGITPTSTTTILEDGQTQSEVETTFDSTGSNPLTLKEHDWGSGAPGPVLRTTTWTYSGPFLDRVTRKIVQDSTGTTKFRQDIAYDSTSITICPTGVPGHIDSYNCSYTMRGNPTSITNYTNASAPSGAITKSFTYDAFGNLVQAAVDCCQQKTWNFSSTTQYASPDSVVSGASGGNQLTTSYIYNPYRGWPTAITDSNGQKTSYIHDEFGDVTSMTRPDNVVVNQTFSFGAGSTTTATIPIQGSASQKSISTLDGLGRTVKTQVLDANGVSYQISQVQYDPVSRPYMTSNPHNSTAQYWTTTQLDALGRASKILLPDGAQTTVSYSLNTSISSDPAGKAHKSVADGLGRMTSIYEPDPANGNSLTVQTAYTYSVLDLVTAVSQGVQSRTYTRDDLGRITSLQVPESKQVAVSYLYNSSSLLTQRTDARGVIATYGYDTMNRLQSVSYNVGATGVPATPSVTLTYGTNSGQNNNGRLITMTDGVGSESYTYDSLGRMTQLQKVVSGMTYTFSYSYNLGNQLASITYPSGRLVQQSFDSIGRLSSVADTFNTVNTTRVSGLTYNTAFQVTGLTYGNGVAASLAYSPDRLQMQSLAYSMGSSTLFSSNYWYKTDATNCPNAPSGNNGQIQCITDNVDSGRTVSYTYDALYRLTSAITNGSANFMKWGLSWTYDRYGNRMAQTATADSPPSDSVSIDPSSNHFIESPFTYDANGNMTNDSTNTLVYDGANRLLSATGGSGSGTYTYDGNNLRVKKVSGSTATVYIFSGSKVVAEYDNGAAPSSPSREYIYSGGILLTKIESGASTYFHQDHLSNRVLTDSNGNVVGQLANYPFGNKWYSYNTTTKWLFTTYERDPESGNDYALSRYYNNSFGRFLSPDPLGGSPANPQSQNLYSYTGNDPINRADPSGLLYNFVIPYTPHTGAESLFTNLLPEIIGILGDPEGPLGPAHGWDPESVQAPDLGLPSYLRNPPSPTKITGPRPQPPPPPGFQDCLNALGERGTFSRALARAYNNWDSIQAAASANGLDGSILAAIGLRETKFLNIPEYGYGQFERGMGVFQIDARYHPDAIPIAYNIPQAAAYAAGLLGDSYDLYRLKGSSNGVAMGQAVRDYNASSTFTAFFGLVYAGTGDEGFLDIGTTGQSYVSNVLEIASDCFP
jgi:RHS repeat-associated protein